MSDIKEKLLIYRLTTKKDPESYGLLYDLYIEKIYRFVYFKVGNKQDAEDITSEVFLKVWNHINEDKEIKSFSGLLYQVARNLVIDWYRAQAKNLPNVSLEETQEKISDETGNDKWYQMMDLKSEAKIILTNLEKLKQEYQEVVTLRYIEELEIGEIAQIMDKNKTAVRVTLHRAMKKLRELCEE